MTAQRRRWMVMGAAALFVVFVWVRWRGSAPSTAIPAPVSRLVMRPPMLPRPMNPTCRPVTAYSSLR